MSNLSDLPLVVEIYPQVDREIYPQVDREVADFLLVAMLILLKGLQILGTAGMENACRPAKR